jgi:hypothetical protein
MSIKGQIGSIFNHSPLRKAFDIYSAARGGSNNLPSWGGGVFTSNPFPFAPHGAVPPTGAAPTTVAPITGTIGQAPTPQSYFQQQLTRAFTPTQFSGLYNDGMGGMTYSKDTSENNQYGYWGKDAYAGPSPFDSWNDKFGFAPARSGGDRTYFADFLNSMY